MTATLFPESKFTFRGMAREVSAHPNSRPRYQLSENPKTYPQSGSPLRNQHRTSTPRFTSEMTLFPERADTCVRVVPDAKCERSVVFLFEPGLLTMPVFVGSNLLHVT